MRAPTKQRWFVFERRAVFRFECCERFRDCKLNSLLPDFVSSSLQLLRNFHLSAFSQARVWFCVFATLHLRENFESCKTSQVRFWRAPRRLKFAVRWSNCCRLSRDSPLFDLQARAILDLQFCGALFVACCLFVCWNCKFVCLQVAFRTSRLNSNLNSARKLQVRCLLRVARDSSKVSRRQIANEINSLQSLTFRALFFFVALNRISSWISLSCSRNETALNWISKLAAASNEATREICATIKARQTPAK